MHQPAFQECIATKLPVTLCFDDGHRIEGTLFSLSRSGALVRTQAPYPPAKTAILTLQTDEDHELRVPVTVVHRGNRLVGLMLRELDSAASTAIDCLLHVGARQGAGGAAQPTNPRAH